MDIKEQAKQDYLDGMSIKDIADKLGKSASTVRSWKSRGKWEAPTTKTDKKPKKKSATQRNATLQQKNATQHENVATQVIPEEAIEELAGSDLSDKHKAFVIEYMKKFNATQAYMNVYGADYNTAMVNGSKLLRNTKVQAAINELKKAKFNQIAITREDLIADLVKEAKADIGDVIDFGRYNETIVDNDDNPYYDTEGNEIVAHRSWVQVKDKDMVDTSTIKKITQGKDGLNVELHDKDKSRKQLFELLADIDEETVADNKNGLMNAISNSTGGAFGDEDEIET